MHILGFLLIALVLLLLGFIFWWSFRLARTPIASSAPTDTTRGSGEDSGSGSEGVAIRHDIHGFAWGIFALSLALPIIVAPLLSGVSVTMIGIKWSIWPFLLLLPPTIALLGVTYDTIKVEEIAEVTLLEYPILIRRNGLLITLRPMRVTKVPFDVMEIHIPGPSAKLFLGDEKDHGGQIPPGLIRPLRVTFPEWSKEYTADKMPITVDFSKIGNLVTANHPLLSAVTLPVVIGVRFRVTNPVNLRRNIGAWKSREELESKFLETFYAVAQSFTQQVLSRIPVAVALIVIAEINEALRERFQEKTRGWGIEFETVALEDILLTHAVNTALQARAVAKAQADALIRKAEGDKQAAILTGEGKGLARKAELEGEAQGMKAMRVDLGVDGEVIVMSQSLKDISGKGTAINLVGSDLSGIAGMLLTGLSRSIAQTQPTAPTSPATPTS